MRTKMHPLRRKELVYHYAVMYGTGSVTEIRDLIKRDTEHSVSRNAIYKDLRAMNDNVAQWTHEQAKSQWMARVQRMYIDTNMQILNIQKIIQKIVDAEPEIPKELANAIALISEPADKKAAIKELDKLLATAKAYKHGGKVAFQIQTMIEAQKHLVDIMTDQPLYAKMQEYAKQADVLYGK